MSATTCKAPSSGLSILTFLIFLRLWCVPSFSRYDTCLMFHRLQMDQIGIPTSVSCRDYSELESCCKHSGRWSASCATVAYFQKRHWHIIETVYVWSYFPTVRDTDHAKSVPTSGECTELQWTFAGISLQVVQTWCLTSANSTCIVYMREGTKQGVLGQWAIHDLIPQATG